MTYHVAGSERNAVEVRRLKRDLIKWFVTPKVAELDTVINVI